MPRSLLLFDIDGTLMITKGAGSRCLQRAGEIVFGAGFTWGDITVGTLDPQIFEQLAAHNSICNAGDYLERFRDTYLSELEAELKRIPEDITLMPGVLKLLEALYPRTHRDGDITLGILTGNFEAAATLKLQAAGLDLKMFPVAAYAEDGESRNDLPRVAIARAEAIHRESIPPERVYIIGDTPRDIECARANGCVPISVATGRFTVPQLRAAGGDLVMESLADHARIFALLESQPLR